MAEEKVLVADEAALLSALENPAGVITLDADISVEEAQVQKSCTIDLNGHVLSAKTKTALICKGNCEVVILGEVEGSKVHGTIKCGAQGADGTKVTIKGGEYEAAAPDQAALQTNGLCQNITLTCENASFFSTDDTLYIAGGGVVTLTKCSIQGATGIYAKGSKINLIDTAVSADGEAADPKPNGASSTGDGIIIDAKNGYTGNVELVLDKDCVVSSINRNAVCETYTDANKTAAHKMVLAGLFVGPVTASEFFKQALDAGTATVDFSEALFTQPVSNNLLKEGEEVFQQVDGTFRVLDAETGLQETLFGTPAEIAQAKSVVDGITFAPVNQSTVIDEVSRSFRDMNTIRAQKGEITAVHSVIGKVLDIFRDVAKEEHTAEELQSLKEKALSVYLTLYRAIETDGLMK